MTARSTMSFGPAKTKALSAASKGDLATLKSLKEQLNLSECSDKFGATPVHYAARAGKVDCLRWLIHTAGVSGNKPANNGASPAHDAAATGQLDCLQWLIENGGCSATSRDTCGATPLHLAARFGHLSVVVWLVESMGCAATDKAQNGVTPVHLAAAKGSINCLRWLTQHNSNSVNRRADNGTTPVYFAAQEGRLECLQFLVSQVDGNARLRASDGMAPVHAAAQMGQLECLTWLIEHAEVSSTERDNDGATPAHFAAARGHVHVLRWLLTHGAKIETDDLGGTPLHDAAEHGQLEALKVLISATGVDPQICDLDGLSPADLAEECGHTACAEFLRNYKPPELPEIHMLNGMPPYDMSSTNYAIQSTLTSLHSLSRDSGAVTSHPSPSKASPVKRDPVNISASTKRDTGTTPVKRDIVSSPVKRDMSTGPDSDEETSKNELQDIFAKLQKKAAAEEIHEEPKETPSESNSQNYKTQDPFLLNEVRQFENNVLKNVPVQKKNLKPTIVGRVAPDPQSITTKSKTTEEQLGSQAASWVRPTMGKPAEPAPEPEPEPEEEEDEYADLPLWKRALMKKRAEETRKKEQADRRKQEEEKAKWQKIPVWKRAVLERKEAQRAKERVVQDEQQQKAAEKQALFDALPEWKKKLILQQKQS